VREPADDCFLGVDRPTCVEEALRLKAWQCVGVAVLEDQFRDAERGGGGQQLVSAPTAARRGGLQGLAGDQRRWM